MEYVYLLVNNFVPELVKFGFSRRDPTLRAKELSSPTGVPGEWVVHHYWMVEDGFGVEQEVFRRLRKHRVPGQEFLRLKPEQAIQLISQEIGQIGTNPTKKKREEQEGAYREWEIEDRAQKEHFLRLQALQKKVMEEISEAQKPIRDRKDKDLFGKMKIVSFLIFAIAFMYHNDKGMLTALFYGIGIVITCYLFPVIPIGTGLIFNDKKYDLQLNAIERKILESNGISSLEDLFNDVEFHPQNFPKH